MIRSSFSPISSAILLRETGEIVGADGASAMLGTSGDIVLSRALCVFEFLQTAPGLSAAQAREAAFLHAEAYAPFVTPGGAVFGGDDGYGVWWWDAARVEQLLGRSAAAFRFTPESMAQTPGESWRLVRGADGFEAQHWRRGRLVASQWRRGAFDAARWKSFVESTGPSDNLAPETPPTPVTPERRHTGARERLERMAAWLRVEIGGWAVAALALAVALGFWGHAARYQQVAAQQQGAVALTPTAAAKARNNEALVRAATASAPIPEHLIAVADLLVALETSGLEPASWESGNGKVRATASGETEIDALGARLEANPRLRNVAPLRANGVIVVTADVEASAASLADATP